MDPLTALRQAVMAARDGEIVFDKEKRTITIDGTSFSAESPTAFKAGKKGKPYPLLSVWLCWQNKDRPAQDLIRLCTMHKTTIVLVTDKAALVQYLQGAVEALEYIDTSLLHSGDATEAATTGDATGTGAGSSAIGVGGKPANIAAAVAHLFGDDSNGAFILESSMMMEIPQPGRSRQTVMQAPGRVSILSYEPL